MARQHRHIEIPGPDRRSEGQRLVHNPVGAVDGDDLGHIGQIFKVSLEALRKNKGKPAKNATVVFAIFQTFVTGEGQPI